MLGGQEVYRAIEVTDDVQTAKLGLLDQVRLIIANLSNDDVAELETAEKLSAEKLRKMAALTDFVEKAIKRMDEVGENSVTAKLSSEFLPYIDEVLNDKNGLGRYYNIKVIKKDLPIGVKHYVVIRIWKKLSMAE